MPKVILSKIWHKIYYYCRLCRYLQGLIFKTKKVAAIRRTVRGLKGHVARKSHNALVVFDNKASPPTYGDLIYVILLARYLIARDGKVTFVLIQGEYRSDWAPLGIPEREEFEREQYRVIKALLKGGTVSVAKMTWDQFTIRKQEQVDKLLIFDRQVDKRQPIYHYCFDALNMLLSFESPGVIRKTLFSLTEERPRSLVAENTAYVAFGVRYSAKWELHRNTTDSEFVCVVTLLAKLYPECMIAIISDKNGCDHFRHLTPANVPVIFSKDISDDFLIDANLVVNAVHYVQLRGGGLSLFRIYSLSPYYISLTLANESKWSATKLTPWQTVRQRFGDSSQSLQDIEIDLLAIGGENNAK